MCISYALTSSPFKETGKRKRTNYVRNCVKSGWANKKPSNKNQSKSPTGNQNYLIINQYPLKIWNVLSFSYWDGSGHRKTVRMKKGNTIYQFLQRCLESLRKDFHELKTISADQLMYVKEDLIIPHHYSFYDFIVTKVWQHFTYFKKLSDGTL